MRSTARRLTSVQAIIAYVIVVLVILNNAVGTIANIDFVLTARGNSRLVALWNFFTTPKGNFVAVILVALWVTGLLLWPDKSASSEGESHSRKEASEAPKSRWTASYLGLTKLHVEILFWICLYSEYSTAEKIASELRTDASSVRGATDILIEKGLASIDRGSEPHIYRVTAAGVSVVKSSLCVK